MRLRGLSDFFKTILWLLIKTQRPKIDRISFFVSKCVSCVIHKRNIYISNDDLNAEILKHIALLFLKKTFL